MIPRFTWSCKNPWNSTCTKWNLVIKIFKEVKLLKPLTYIICSMVRIEHINTYFFMMKCEIKIFSLEFMPSLGNGAAICPLQKSMKSKYWLHEDLGTTYYFFQTALWCWWGSELIENMQTQAHQVEKKNSLEWQIFFTRKEVDSKCSTYMYLSACTEYGIVIV